MKTPVISVIVPCYNQAHFLSEALESVLAQTYPDWECIIINDGSPDNTEEVAKEWCIKDIRFKYLKKENGGLSSARNAGLKRSSGKYIQFLDADDVIDKTKFDKQISQLKETSDFALSYCDYFPSTEFNLNEVYPGRYLTPKFKNGEYLAELITNWETRLSIPCHCFLFDSRLFLENNIFFDEKLPNHEDWECWMNIFALNPKVYFLNEKLAIYRIRSGAMCSDFELMKSGFSIAINKQIRKHKKNLRIHTLLKTKYQNINLKSRKNGISIYKMVFKNRIMKKLKQLLVKKFRI
jgi:glycosyltransferase involved in cell wall biosynthesis